jgi:hypothetical protein
VTQLEVVSMTNGDMSVEGTEDLNALLDQALRMQGGAAVPQLLQAASRILEHCAYELARSEMGGQVSRIILISDELDRMAKAQGRLAAGRGG